MNFGIYVAAQTTADTSPSENLMESIKLARLARKLGFDSVATGHHYLSYPYRQFQPIPFVARLAAETGTMRVGILITLLPLLNPVDVAEQIATLDVITGGRFIFGIGLGYRDIELEAFGIRSTERVTRFDESIELIRLLWTKNRVTYAGKYFRIRNATMTNKPIQHPHPPVWMAANSDLAVVRTAKLADTWIVNPHVSLATLERQVELYKDALHVVGKRFPREFPAMRELYVAPTTEQAFREAGPHLERKYRTYSEWGQDKIVPKGEEFTRPFEELAEDRFIIGNPQDCIESIEKLGKIGINHCIVRMHWPKSRFEKTIKSAKLLARTVMPNFKD